MAQTADADQLMQQLQADLDHLADTDSPAAYKLCGSLKQVMEAYDYKCKQANRFDKVRSELRPSLASVLRPVGAPPSSSRLAVAQSVGDKSTATATAKGESAQLQKASAAPDQQLMPQSAESLSGVIAQTSVSPAPVPQHAIAAIEHGAAQHADGRGDAEGVSGMPADVPQQPVNPVSAPHEEAWHASTAELAKSSITASDGVTGVHAAADCKPDCNTVQHTSKTQGSEQSFDMLDDDSVEGSEQSFDMLDDASMDGPAAHISGTDQKQHSLSALEILMSCCLTQTVSFCLLLRTSLQLPQDQQTLTSAQLLAHLELQHHWLTPLLTLA